MSGVRIINLQASNYKVLVAVEIKPDRNMVIIRGENGAGKSSVLDAIMVAVGGAALVPDKPLRDGTNKAEIRLELDNGLIITRKFTEKGTYLEITNADGAKYPKPQDMLDALLGDSRIAFDPIAFANMKPAKQREELLRVVHLSINMEEHEAQRQALYEERRFANREKDEAEAVVNSLTYDEGAPDSEQSVQDILEKIKVAQLHESKVNFIATRKNEIAATIEKLMKELGELDADAERLEEEKSYNLDELQASIASSEETNKRVRANRQYLEVAARLKAAKVKAESADAALKDMDNRKEIALQTAEFPIAGLSITDEGIIYKGIPFQQLASSEQLRIAIAIAMAANPTLKVLLCRDGSLLDAKNMKVLEEMAGENDFQVWFETVGNGKPGIIIQEGEVKEVVPHQPDRFDEVAAAAATEAEMAEGKERALTE